MVAASFFFFFYSSNKHVESDTETLAWNFSSISCGYFSLHEMVQLKFLRSVRKDEAVIIKFQYEQVCRLACLEPQVLDTVLFS